jgi:predicted phosphodiesterase
MRLLVMSDLHVEHAGFDGPFPHGAFDAVVLAGDIGQATFALRWARGCFPDVPIVQVAGNHEYFDTVRESALDTMRELAHRLQIHFLEHDAVIIGDVEFLGCTLWTDYRLYERAGRPRIMSAAEAMAGAHRTMLDDRLIRVGDPFVAGAMRAFTPQDSLELHQQARQWLDARTAQACAARARVVVTHHLPSWHSVSPPFMTAASNPAFASDVDTLLPLADVWIHGHTHSSHDYLCGGCRVVCNPRGYPMRTGGFENPRFTPSRLITV